MSDPLAFFPARIAMGQFQSQDRNGRPQSTKVSMTPEFYRALQGVLHRLGGESSEVPDIDQIFEEVITAAFPPETTADSDALQMVVQAAGEREWAFDPMVFATVPTDKDETNATPLPFTQITPVASPVSFVATARCAINIDGAIIWASLTMTRAATTIPVSATLIELNAGDVIDFQYPVGPAPTLTVIPR
ncbi:hypothetical protein H0A71_06575 [Alcaligenaceae bacterium]|nr:hypothetical protein [Alcaligenaceae bacterium]